MKASTIYLTPELVCDTKQSLKASCWWWWFDFLWNLSFFPLFYSCLLWPCLFCWSVYLLIGRLETYLGYSWCVQVKSNFGARDNQSNLISTQGWWNFAWQEFFLLSSFIRLSSWFDLYMTLAIFWCVPGFIKIKTLWRSHATETFI